MHHFADDTDAEALSDELLEEAQKQVGNHIKTLRQERGLSQRRAAHDAGMHQTDWSRIERALVEPRLTTLLRIQHALRLEAVESLFGVLPSSRLLDPERRE